MLSHALYFRYARQYVSCVIVLGGVPTVLSNVMAYLLHSTGRSREASVGIMMGGLLDHLLGMYGIVWSQAAADFLNVLLCACVYLGYLRKNPELRGAGVAAQ